MTLLKGYLDSNVLINFIWWWYSKNRPEDKEVASLAKAIESGAFEPVISSFCLWELAAHFRDYEISKKVIKAGFSYRQFSQMRKSYPLTEHEERLVQAKVRKFEKNPYVSLVTVTRLGKRALSEVNRFVQADIEIVDAFHLEAAVSYGCDFLVTGDEELRLRAKQLYSKSGRLPPINLVSLKEFLVLPELRASLEQVTMGSVRGTGSSSRPTPASTG